MDSFLKSIGNTLEVVGKVLMPQKHISNDQQNKNQVKDIPIVKGAVLPWNNENLKPKGAGASVASPGMF
jgi:hypothetical protein